MILTFARLQRLSGLERPSAIKKWLQRIGVNYLIDGEKQPFTTLDAFNRRLSCNVKDHTTEPNRETFRFKGLREHSGRWFVVRRQGEKSVRYKLTLVDEGAAALREAYDKLVPPDGPPRTVRHLLHRYVNEGISKLSEVTQKHYRQLVEARVSFTNDDGQELLTGLVPYFGDKLITKVKSVHVAQYLSQGEKLNRSGAANRERAVLSGAFEWAMREGLCGEEFERNPCHGVRRNTEKPSRVYVETSALVAAYARASAALQILLNAAYLTGFRQVDLIKMKRTQWTQEGIVLDESKTGHRRIMPWQPGMREVWERAIAHGDLIATKLTKKLPVARPLPKHIFVNQRGKPWTPYGINSAMRRAGTTFAFRQLRPKAQTDGKGKNVLGHTGAMLQRYTRREELEALG